MTGVGEVFRCACCGGEFPKSRSDEEAFSEAERAPGIRDVPVEERVLACEDCFKELLTLFPDLAPDPLN